MPCILHIDTSTDVCSAALTNNGVVVEEKVSYEGHSHASLLGLYVADCLKSAKENGLSLDAVAVSSGPGSYTGLRIGVSMAKGICFGLGIPLISVPTLELLASTAIRNYPENDALYCAMLDARRMEVYAAIYNQRREQVREVKADIVTAETYVPYLNKGKVCFFGNGSEKCKSVIDHPNAVFIPDVHPVAAEERFRAPLPLVVAGADPDRIDVAPVGFDLRMHDRIAVHLAGRCLQDLRTDPLGQPEHVDCAVDAGFDRLDRIALIVDRRGRTGQIVDLVALHVEREGHIVPDHFKTGIFEQMVDIPLGSRVEVVHTDHLVALFQQHFAQPRPEKSAAAGHQDPFVTHIRSSPVKKLYHNVSSCYNTSS